MSSSALPQGFSIFQPTLGAQLQFFPAVGTQELDELIHAHLIGPASSQEKRATLALDFLEHAQMTGQTFKFYPVYTVAASPATSVSSSFNTSPTTASWDWSHTSRAASVSSRSSQHRVSKPTSPASRMRTTDFSSLPGMKIMTKDGLDVTNSASRGSKTKEQRDHAHLMRIIKACDSCKRKKIRCDPSHKKRGAAAPATPAAATAKVAKKARTVSPSAPSQSASPPQSVSPSSVSPQFLVEDLSSFTASPFEMDATFSFDALDTFAPMPAAPSDPWDEFVQYPPMAEVDDYDFFVDPESYLSSQSSDAGMSGSQLSVPASSPRSGAPPGRGPDGGRAESHAELLNGAASGGEVLAQLPYESPDSAGDYTDFNLYSPGSTFSEDERMLDIGSSTSGLSTRSAPSPVDSPRRPPSVESPDAGVADVGTGLANVAEQSPFTLAVQNGPVDRGHEQDASAGGMAGALSVLSRSDVVMRTNEQGQLIICCPPGTVVVNNSGGQSSNAGLANVSTVVESSNASFYIPRELSESAIATVSSATGPVDTSVATWLDHGEGGQAPQLVAPIAASPQHSPMQLADGVGRSQSSRFVHRNTDLAQQPVAGLAIATPIGGDASHDGVSASGGVAAGLVSGSAGLGSASSAGMANGLATGSRCSPSPVSSESPTLASPSLAQSSVDVHNDSVSVESGSVSHHSVVQDGSTGLVDQSSSESASTLADDGEALSDAVCSSSDESQLGAPDRGEESSIDQPGTSDSPLAASVPLVDNATTTSVVPASGRPVRESESAFDVSQTVASTISQRDTTGIGRTAAGRDAQDAVTTADLAVMMQTIISQTLLAATYAQSMVSSTTPRVERIACRERTARSIRNVMAPSARVSAVC